VPPRSAIIDRMKRLLALFAVAVVVAGVGGCAAATTVVRAERFTQGGGSMEPTVKPGQVISTRAVEGKYKPRHGDVVLFHSPGGRWGDRKASFLKRVIAIGGETIACCNPAGKVTINGKPLAEPYVAHDPPLDTPPSPYSCLPRRFGPVAVATGTVLRHGRQPFGVERLPVRRADTGDGGVRRHDQLTGRGVRHGPVRTVARWTWRWRGLGASSAVGGRSSLVPASGSFDPDVRRSVPRRLTVGRFSLRPRPKAIASTGCTAPRRRRCSYRCPRSGSCVKKAGGPDFKVSALEGLWWAEDLRTFLTGDKSEWDWTMMIRQPDTVTGDLLAHLANEVAAKKSIPAARQLRLISFEEGAAAQVLHVGPYATEASTIARLHEFIREQGFTFDGHRHKHHEIYLGDPRRSAPEKLRTIIRQSYAS
jgi:signal peptidase I